MALPWSASFNPCGTGHEYIIFSAVVIIGAADATSPFVDGDSNTMYDTFLLKSITYLRARSCVLLFDDDIYIL